MNLTNRTFPRRPGLGWQHIPESAVWDHSSGLRIHRIGMARLPDGRHVSRDSNAEWSHSHAAQKLTGYNDKRALMVWALSLLSL